MYGKVVSDHNVIKRCFCLFVMVICMLGYASAGSYGTPVSVVNGETVGSKGIGQGYHRYWQYWCQGASTNAGFRESGCYMTAQAKMLVEMGIASGDPSVFNPDIFYNEAGYYREYAKNYAEKKGSS